MPTEAGLVGAAAESLQLPDMPVRMESAEMAEWWCRDVPPQCVPADAFQGLQQRSQSLTSGIKIQDCCQVSPVHGSKQHVQVFNFDQDNYPLFSRLSPPWTSSRQEAVCKS